ncbi:MAG: VanZ family protein [Dermatophilaceae bacterium]
MSEIAELLGFFVRTGVLPALAVGVVGSVVVTAVAVRQGWLDRPAWLVFASVLSVAGVLVFTLFREGVLIVEDVVSGTPLVVPGWSGLGSWSPNGWWRATADPLRSTQVLLNIALFVPAVFLWTVITRRPLRVIAALAGLSVAIEIIQAVTGLGAADVADIIANVAGAVLGAGAAVLAGWVGDAVAGRTVGKRRWILRGITVAVVAVCAAALPGLGATARQAALAEEAQQGFKGTVLADLHRWAQDDELDRVWRGVPPVYSDGFTLDADSATARYPARFLGRRTCILVTWDALGVQTQPASGEVCERTSL